MKKITFFLYSCFLIPIITIVMLNPRIIEIFNQGKHQTILVIIVLSHILILFLSYISLRKEFDHTADKKESILTRFILTITLYLAPLPPPIDCKEGLIIIWAIASMGLNILLSIIAFDDEKIILIFSMSIIFLFNIVRLWDILDPKNIYS